MFAYESITSDSNIIAIDDISIINGPCGMYLKCILVNYFVLQL